MTPEAKTYLDEAMEFIQENSVKREQINWSELRQEVYARAAHAQTPAETHLAIQRGLELLNDHHSFFRDPEKEQLGSEGKMKHAGVLAIYPSGIIAMIYPGSAAAAAGLHVGDRIETINGQPLTALTSEQLRRTLRNAHLDLTLRPAEQGSSSSVSLHAIPFSASSYPQGRRLAHNLGYLELPGQNSSNPEDAQAYAEIAQQIIRDVDQTATDGWIVDLRRTTGGGLWFMLAGVGPILGEGACSSFVSSTGQFTAFYRRGRAWVEQSDDCAQVDEPYELKQPAPPVAVLTSQLTGSAGELVSLAFCGRPRSRSFGEPTYGAPTGNEGKVLSDGAIIALTTHLGGDRTGQVYDRPLVPDQHVQIDWTQVGTANDPVLQAAIQWLHTEEERL